MNLSQIVTFYLPKNFAYAAIWVCCGIHNVVHKKWGFRGRQGIFSVPIHKIGLFCGQDLPLQSFIHKIGLFCGQDLPLQSFIHKKWGFRGRQDIFLALIHKIRLFRGQDLPLQCFVHKRGDFVDSALVSGLSERDRDGAMMCFLIKELYLRKYVKFDWI